MLGRSRSTTSALLTALVILASLVVPLAGPAVANHPANVCLDVQPEDDTNPISNSPATGAEDNRHVLTATLRSTIDASASPPTAFVTCEGSGTGANTTTVNAATPVNIDFEFVGARPG